MTAVPPTLVQFGDDLERALAGDLARRRSRRHRLVLRLAAVGTASAIVALAAGVTSELTGRGPSVVERAAAALAAPPGSILHIRMTGTQENGDGTSATWQSESWQATYDPQPRRQIERMGNGDAAETATSGDGTVGIYDAARNAIYLARESELVEGVQPKPVPKPAPKSAGAPTARRWDRGAPIEPLQIDAPAESFRQQVVALLESGQAEVEHDVRIAGREAVRLTLAGGRATYIVDAATYAPIELRTTGTIASTVLRFPAYEVLSATNEHRALLGLVTQHPEARVVHNLDEYRAAQARLFPNG